MKTKRYSISDMLYLLQDQVQLEEFHIYKRDLVFNENPFPENSRYSANAISIITKGKAKLRINNNQYDIEKNDLIFLSPDCLTNISEITEGLQFVSITFSHVYLKQQNFNTSLIDSLFQSLLSCRHIVRLDEKSKKHLLYLIDIIHHLNSEEKMCKITSELSSRYFNILLFEILIHLKTSTVFSSKSTSHQMSLYNRFLTLLNIHGKVLRNIKFYSDKLDVGTVYLSKVVKAVCGRTSTDLIEDRILDHARNLLIQTDFSIAKIADELYFSDQSAFGKFFKRKVKMTPNEFRKHQGF